MIMCEAGTFEAIENTRNKTIDDNFEEPYVARRSQTDTANRLTWPDKSKQAARTQTFVMVKMSPQGHGYEYVSVSSLYSKSSISTSS
jgi:hypothetical protein